MNKEKSISAEISTRLCFLNVWVHTLTQMTCALTYSNINYMYTVIN